MSILMLQIVSWHVVSVCKYTMRNLPCALCKTWWSCQQIARTWLFCPTANILSWYVDTLGHSVIGALHHMWWWSLKVVAHCQRYVACAKFVNCLSTSCSNKAPAFHVSCHNIVWAQIVRLDHVICHNFFECLKQMRASLAMRNRHQLQHLCRNMHINIHVCMYVCIHISIKHV